MGRKDRRRAIAQLPRRAAADTDAVIVDGDPISVGPDRTINVDLTKVAAPHNVYDADHCWIEHERGDVRLYFAKRSRDEAGKFRTRLEIRYPVESLVHHFWRNSREYHPKLRDYVNHWEMPPLQNVEGLRRQPSARDHSEWANFEAMSHAGTEGMIDFYLMPPAGVARFVQGHGSAALKIAPVVRVQMTVFEMLSLLDAAGTVVDEICTYMPSIMGNKD